AVRRGRQAGLSEGDGGAGPEAAGAGGALSRVPEKPAVIEDSKSLRTDAALAAERRRRSHRSLAGRHRSAAAGGGSRGQSRGAWEARLKPSPLKAADAGLFRPALEDDGAVGPAEPKGIRQRIIEAGRARVVGDEV